MVCGGFHIANKLKPVIKYDSTSVVYTNQIEKIEGVSETVKSERIYKAHIAKNEHYKKIRLPSAYLGYVNVDVFDLENGWVALQSIVSGLKGRPDIFVKAIDAEKHRLRPEKFRYDTTYLSKIQPTFINIQTCKNNLNIIKNLSEHNNLTIKDRKKLHAARTYNNAVDIHFNACNNLEFLHTFTNSNNVTNSNVLISVHNVKNLDNAFWTGDNGYMVYGNGNILFRPLGTIDVGGHESGHGCVGALSGLKYRGESGALNEHFADVIGVCNEFFTYYKYNANIDGNISDDINGAADWLIGEDAGKSIKYLRNMSDPHNADQPQPKYYKGKYWGDPNNEKIDHGYVHCNSGVGNWCFYNVAVKIGWREAFRVFWACLQQLCPDSSYIDYRDCLKLCAGRHIRVVKSVLIKVGLGDNVVSDWIL